MATLIRWGVIAFAAAALLPPATPAAQPHAAQQNAAEPPPAPVDAWRRGLMAALGDDFEYLGGEIGRASATVGPWRNERFWFARVRPKTAGEFALSYSFDLEFPAEIRPPQTAPDRAVHLAPIKIGERGAPRLVRPAGWGGSAYSHANVGDTLLIPVHLHRYGAELTFAAVARDDRFAQAFFGVANRIDYERQRQQAAAPPVVQLPATERLDLLASWADVRTSRKAGGPAVRQVSALLEFRQPGEFTLTGQLVDAATVGDTAAVGDQASFRVMPRDQSVTVVLEYFKYQEHTGPFTSSSSGQLLGGTSEVRVGDRVVIACGRHETLGAVEPAAERQGVVVLGPFQAIAPYTVESPE